jgi:hypothetical protein
MPGAWPPVKPGVWHLTGKRTTSKGKPKSWDDKRTFCQDSGWIFRDYWGDGKIDLAGCRWQSDKVGPNTFKVVTECRIRGVASSKSESTVTVRGDDSFEMETRLVEGRRSYSSSQTGRWLSSCGSP